MRSVIYWIWDCGGVCCLSALAGAKASACARLEHVKQRKNTGCVEGSRG
jgi:hypothetical protein